MDLESFERSLGDAAPPAGLTPLLIALWHAGRGEWNAAHDLVGDDASRAAAWVHAWLHREEGDLDNAGYWYRRAQRPAEHGDLRAEWRRIVTELLAG